VAVRTQTLVQLTDELVEELDRRARRSGRSRSALIRELLEQALERDRAQQVSQRMFDGYQRVPQELGQDVWGDLDEWSETNARRNLAGLAAEEEEGRW